MNDRQSEPTDRNPANPYVGPKTFQADQWELYFGRSREARELLSLLIARRLVLFYAQSGAGKSSLINASLIRDLDQQGYEVLPVGRVSGERPDFSVDNIFVYNLITRSCIAVKAIPII